MYWSHPDDPDAYQVPNQFLFGTELLVAPITAPRDPAVQLGSVRAWLPAGTWVDLFSGAGVRRRPLGRDAPRPVGDPGARPAGAIVPLTAPTVPGNDPDNPAALEVLVVVGADGSFEMIEDDGTASGTASTPLSFSQCTGTFTAGPAAGALDCLPATRSWTVTFLSFDGTPSVSGGTVRRGDGRVSITVDDVP